MPKKKRRTRKPPEPTLAAEPKVLRVEKKRRTTRPRKPKAVEPIATKSEHRSAMLQILEAQLATVNELAARLRRVIRER